MINFILFCIRIFIQAGHAKGCGRAAVFINLFFVLFSNPPVFAQHILETEHNQSYVITLQNGAKIYSADNDFNYQIKQSHLALKPETALTDDRILSSQFKNSKNIKRQDLTKKIQKQIKEYEEKTKDIFTDDFKSYPPSNQFSTTQQGNKNCISQRTETHDYSKIYFGNDRYFISGSLDELYSEKFKYYNNKSLSYCFSKVFSTRPPPPY